jgi:tetratricopeptide (TPR) repeat protein
VYAGLKQEARAKEDFGKAEDLCPKSAVVCVLRGRANAILGKTRAAQDDFLKAMKLDDKEPAGFRELAWLLASSPNLQEGKRALDCGRAACELTRWDQWQCLDAFALANAANGGFDEACRWGRKALEVAPRDVQPGIEQRLKLYQAGVAPTSVKQR